MNKSTLQEKMLIMPKPWNVSLKEHLLNGGKIITRTRKDGKHLYLRTVDGWENYLGKLLKEEK